MEAFRLNNVGRKFQKFIHPEDPLNNRDSLKKAQKSAGDFWALRNIYMNVNKGEIIGVIGRNGAGKTTLLNVIAGILSPSEGEVWVNGKVSAMLVLGVGFQQELTGKENIYLNGTLLGLSKHKIDELFLSILDFSELGDFVNAPLGSYSNGMKMRLGFSIAMHNDFEILVTDEIISVGDFYFQKKCMERMLTLKKKGKTVVVVAHDMGLIRNFCDRVYLLEDGKVFFEGDTLETVEKYEFLLNKKKVLSETSRLDMIKETRRWATDMDDWGKREGVGTVNINRVNIYNTWGRNVSQIKAGSKIKVKVGFKAEEEVDNYHFGLAIFREDGVYCYGPNTKLDGIPLKRLKKGKGNFTLSFPSLSLMPGIYYISVAIWDKDELRAYDYHRCRYKLEILGNHCFGQLLTLSSSWMNLTPERKIRMDNGKIKFYPILDYLVGKWENTLCYDSISIGSIRCLDNYGGEDGVFITGRDLKIKIDYKIDSSPEEELLLWVGIYRSDGIYCYGNIKSIFSRGNASEILLLPRLRLLPGGYRVSAGIWGLNKQQFLAYSHGVYTFNMVSDKRDHGTIYLEHFWKTKIP